MKAEQQRIKPEWEFEMNEKSMSDWKTMVDNSSSGGLGAIDQYELVRELGGGGFGTVFSDCVRTLDPKRNKNDAIDKRQNERA